MGALLLMVLASLWLHNFLSEQITQISGPVLPAEITQFDYKRPYFFALGFCAAAMIGMLGSTPAGPLPPPFLKAMYGLALVLAGLYVVMDRGDADLARLGGDAGLGIGIFLSQGLVAGIALVVLAGRIQWPIAALSMVILTGMLLSGTRAALVAVALGLHGCGSAAV